MKSISMAESDDSPLPSTEKRAPKPIELGDDALSLFNEEEQELANAEAMLDRLDELSGGVRALAAAYRRAVREQKRLVRMSDRMQGELRDVNARLEQEIGESARLTEELRQLATTDFLTGAVSRRHFYDLGRHALHRAKQINSPLALIATDIDHFKSVNDSHGHGGGDAALIDFVAAIKGELRTDAVVGRLGGEEFAILLDTTTLDSAANVSERLRSVVEDRTVRYEGRDFSITASFGVATSDQIEFSTVDDDEDPVAKLVNVADAALYTAKNNGRNRVETAD